MRKTVSSLLFCVLAFSGSALAQDAQPRSTAANQPSLGKKLQPYIACINRLSERANASRERYLSWADEKKGPTGKGNIYGLYTLYDPKDCVAGVAKAAQEQPAHAELEKAGGEFAAAVSELVPLLNQANDYYDQGNYKDDKMAKGREMHPKLVAAYTRFSNADKALRSQVDELNDRVQLERLALIEKTEGKGVNYLVTDLMIKAKALLRTEAVEPKAFNLEKVTPAIAALEQAIKDIETFNEGTPSKKVGSSLISNAKTFLTSAKELMRRIRDKVPYSTGDRMLMSGPPGGAWMVSGSPARLQRDYNQLVEAFNRGPGF